MTEGTVRKASDWIVSAAARDIPKSVYVLVDVEADIAALETLIAENDQMVAKGRKRGGSMVDVALRGADMRLALAVLAEQRHRAITGAERESY